LSWKTPLVVLYWLVLFVVAFVCEGAIVLLFAVVLFPDSVIGWIIGLAVAILLTIALLVWTWRSLA
jgi:hypothetical protein